MWHSLYLGSYYLVWVYMPFPDERSWLLNHLCSSMCRHRVFYFFLPKWGTPIINFLLFSCFCSLGILITTRFDKEKKKKRLLYLSSSLFSQLFVTLTEIPGNINLKTERFILAHVYRGFSPWMIHFIVLSLR